MQLECYLTLASWPNLSAMGCSFQGLSREDLAVWYLPAKGCLISWGWQVGKEFQCQQVGPSWTLKEFAGPLFEVLHSSWKNMLAVSSTLGRLFGPVVDTKILQQSCTKWADCLVYFFKGKTILFNLGQNGRNTYSLHRFKAACFPSEALHTLNWGLYQCVLVS